MTSSSLFAEAKRFIPGGVNSPVRAFSNVGGEPFFVSRAAGSHIWDVDGNEFVDYLLSFGSCALGHANPRLMSALSEQLDAGTMFGTCNITTFNSRLSEA